MAEPRPPLRIYLACPYTHDDPEVRRARVEAANRKAAELLQLGLIVFSPLTHSDRLGELMGNPMDHDFWMRQCRAFIEWADEIHVLRLPGWETSRGVAAEIKLAMEMGKPRHYMDNTSGTATGTVSLKALVRKLRGKSRAGHCTGHCTGHTTGHSSKPWPPVSLK